MREVWQRGAAWGGADGGAGQGARGKGFLCRLIGVIRGLVSNLGNQ
jgi:hypothetical protein